MRKRIIIVAVIFIVIGFVAVIALFSDILKSGHVFEFPGSDPVFPDHPSSTTTIPLVPPPPPPKPLDAEPSAKLSTPPEFVKAVYATSWSAGSKSKMDYLVRLIKETELNAVVIDIKDYSGYVTYRSDLDTLKTYDAVEIRIPKINALLGALHAEGIYTIARLSVFQDQRLSLARPELAVMSSSTGAVWKDRKGLSWMDPASREVWEYNARIAHEAFSRGFDEVNFDYIRFPSDGNLDDLKYPVWNGKQGASVIESFWAYLESEFPNDVISADLFGLTTVNSGDLGIGQKFQNAIPHFNHIAPMVYPSHYALGTFGIAKPAEQPYEIVRRSIEGAVAQIKAYEARFATTTPGVLPPKTAAVRPWLQDFDLGAIYTPELVRAQIRAVEEISAVAPSHVSGWMLWSPTNVYTKEALNPEPAAGTSQ